MASIRKRPTSQNWFACIILPDGKRRQFSTGTAVMEDALAIARAAETATRRHQESPQQLRKSLSRLADEFAPPDSVQGGVNPAQWIRAWAAGKRGEVALASWRSYATTANEMADWLEDRGIRTFDAITTEHCREMRDYWAERSSPSTANKKIKHIRQIIQAAIQARVATDNPAKGIPALTQKPTARRDFSETELTLLMANLSGEWLGMAWLALNTGQRLGDLAELTWRGLDLVSATVTFHAAKTGRLVSLPLLPQTVDVLASLPTSDNPSSPVFPGIFEVSKPRRSNAFRDILAGIGLAKRRPRKKRGTKSTKRTTSELSFHSFRHTATTWLKSAGVSDAIARAIIGHESAAVSRSYTHFDMATMREAMSKVAQFQSGKSS